MRTICEEKENTEAIGIFRRNLERLSVDSRMLEWGFPSGDRDYFLTYTLPSVLGDIQIGVPEEWSTRIPHLVRFVKDQGPPSPDVEVNIPLNLNRSVSGVYVKAGSDILLCSRGLFTSYRGKIKKYVSLKYFHQWVQTIDDAGQLSTIIPVCSISSDSLAEDIASFTSSVVLLKEKLKSDSGFDSDSLGDNWGEGSEFEGTKGKSGTFSSEYNYKHGPICNQLTSYLKKYCVQDQFKVLKNIHVDAAIVDLETKVAHSIFEVKTASLPSNQIYTGIGQLQYYRFKYGDSNTQLYLVLPEISKSTETERVLETLGIGILYKSGKQFIKVDGQSFEPNI
ncbi:MULTISPECIES: hypothetical protein [unclassified Vibrio]|uniref:hypothetical protein n=1 Tax=unclassified Vibrio TaxID=2614977 RepID=UPI002553932D|nr:MULTISPECIES: hypothetical protein [unclassified Vibrio]MDK9779658.1 hypothetical protein [Vibrio sp. D401a]MDK9807317.1 hypothetical protein [Vibrio sp. D406a]